MFSIIDLLFGWPDFQLQYRIFPLNDLLRFLNIILFIAIVTLVCVLSSPLSMRSRQLLYCKREKLLFDSVDVSPLVRWSYVRLTRFTYICFIRHLLDRLNDIS